MITFADGCDAVRVASAIYRAAAEGRRVALNEFPRSIAPDA
jgi:predicted dehydrogenase